MKLAVYVQLFSRGGGPKFYLDEKDGIDSSHRTEPQCDHEHNDAHYVTGRGSVVAQSGESQEEATGNTGRVNKTMSSFICSLSTRQTESSNVENTG